MKKLYCIFLTLVVAAIVAAASPAQNECSVPVAQADTTGRGEVVPQVELKTDTAFAYCALEMTGSYDQHEAAFGKLYQEAMNQGIYGGMPFGIYWNSPANTPVEQLKWDVGFTLPPGNAPKPPLAIKKWDFTTMASLKYRGVFGGEEMGNAYGRIYKWIGENGYQPSGPMMEVFLNTPSPDEKGVLFGSVEIIVPVQKAPPAKDAKVK
ncbi:MAG: GyrI-like domain-containing protein [Candidatus Krumholzibacteria bacterium]|nr:GyrI-like domain-containing protein [Candidatus Krumholzibacteria bacterium]